MEFELPKINVSFEYDKEKDEIVFVINGVEKRVKTEDMITEMEKLQEQNTALEQQPCEDCISRAEAINAISHAELSFQVESDLNFENYKREVQEIADGILKGQVKAISDLPSIQPKPKTEVLDKIRAEIKEESRFCPLTEGLERALEIIDKYKAESEGKE